MKILILVLLTVFNFSAVAQSNASCKADRVLPRIYSSINKYLCMNLFFGGDSSGTQKEAAMSCSNFLLMAGASSAIKGVAAGAINNRIETNRTAEAIKKEKKRLFTDMKSWNRMELNFEGPTARMMQIVKDEELKRISQEQHNLTKMLLSLNKSKALSKTSLNLVKSGFIVGTTLAATGVLTAASVILDATPAGCSELINMYIDTENDCSYKPEIGPNTARYLGLPVEEQRKIMTDLPDMCEKYSLLAEKLESDLNKAFPNPEFQVTACGKNNEVTGVNLKYDTEIFNLTKSGNTLIAKTGATHRVNYELFLKDKGFGVDSIESVRASMKTSKVTRVHIPSEVLKDPSRSNDTAQRELAGSLRALHGFTSVKAAVGNQCRSYLEQQGEEADATAPAHR